MKTYVRVESGLVEEIIGPVVDDAGVEILIERRFHPDFVARLIDITDVAPKPEIGWAYDGVVFTPAEVTAA